MEEVVVVEVGNEAVASVVVALVGFWHLLCSCRALLRSPATFCARPCHPLPLLNPPLALLEPFLLLLFLPFSAAYRLLLASHPDPLVHGSTPAFRMASFLHLAILLAFLTFVSFSLLAHYTPLPHGFPFLAAAVAFSFQCRSLLFDAHITSGLERKCDSLLSLSAGICALNAGLLACRPESFLADLGLNMGLLLQGFWRLQIALCLHVDAFIPRGCHRLLDVSGSVEGSTQCDLESDRVRATTLMDLLFLCHVFLVVVVTVITYGVLAKAHGRRKHFIPDAPQSSWGHLEMQTLPNDEH